MSKQLIDLLIGTLLVLALLFSSCHTKKMATTHESKIGSSLSDTVVALIPKDTTVRLREIQYPIPPQQEQAYTTKDYYERALKELEEMLNGNQQLSFKRAVFVTENAYFKERLNYNVYCSIIQSKIEICKLWMNGKSFKEYPYADSVNILKNASIFTAMTDTIFLIDNVEFNTPLKYNFDDFLGNTYWSSQFVSTLLQTEVGNCHSLPFLYKILANELNAKTYLALAPNHIYLKNRSKQLGWYNTELTSGEFPTDAWVKASGYITIESIRSGIYMDTLSQQQSVGLCVYDLAKGYVNQTDNYTDGFVLKCCDLVLKHHPMNINALLFKAETLRKKYESLFALHQTEQAQQTFQEMQGLYVKGIELGYREMPQEMYNVWINSIHEQEENFINQSISRTFKTYNR